MENFRQFEAGPDPFGRKWQIQFKWLQTATSLRHSDSVDVKFVVGSDGVVTDKIIAMMHPDLLELSRKKNRPLTDAWCSRLAALHIKHMIETGEDLEKDLVTMTPRHLEERSEQFEGDSEPRPAGYNMNLWCELKQYSNPGGQSGRTLLRPSKICRIPRWISSRYRN